MMTPTIDRRQMSRHPHRLAVSYSILENKSATPILYTKTHTNDISRSGLQAKITESIPPGSLIQLCIHVPNSRSPVLMVGKARWTGAGDTGVTGIQFIGTLPPQIGERMRLGAIPQPLRDRIPLGASDFKH